MSQFRVGKYNNIRTEYKGRAYASRKEANRAWELDMLTRAGEVLEWTPQVKYRFTHNGVHICDYIADFLIKWKSGTTTVEDVKGVRTAIYVLKRKLMKAFYNIEIIET